MYFRAVKNQKSLEDQATAEFQLRLLQEQDRAAKKRKAIELEDSKPDLAIVASAAPASPFPPAPNSDDQPGTETERLTNEEPLVKPIEGVKHGAASFDARTEWSAGSHSKESETADEEKPSAVINDKLDVKPVVPKTPRRTSDSS